MIKICTVYFEGKYSPQYVNNLYNGLKKHSTQDFEFICLSDNHSVCADKIYPLYHNLQIQKHWHKLKFFCELFGQQSADDEIIIMDIDQVICNNVDDLLTFPVDKNELVTFAPWWKQNTLMVHGGWYKFRSGQLNCIWNKFVQDPEKWQMYFYNKNIVNFKFYGEQNFVDLACKQNDIKVTHMPGQWLGKYTLDPTSNRQLNMQYSEKFDRDYMILDEPHNDVKLVHFMNPNTDISNSKDAWVKELWKA